MNKEIKLNSNTPSYQLNNIVFSVVNSLPIFLNAFISEDYHMDKNIIYDKSQYFFAAASEQNFPEAFV